jgi:hypothetical protein
MLKPLIHFYSTTLDGRSLSGYGGTDFSLFRQPSSPQHFLDLQPNGDIMYYRHIFYPPEYLLVDAILLGEVDHSFDVFSLRLVKECSIAHDITTALRTSSELSPSSSCIALPVAVVSQGDHGATILEPHRVVPACRYLRHVHPIAHIALPMAVVPHSNGSAVVPEPYSVPPACADLDDVRPVADITLSIGIVSQGDQGTIGS